MLKMTSFLRLIRLLEFFSYSHRKCAQASEDSVVLNLDDALSNAYEEIEELRHRVLELETQAAELLKSNEPKGEPFEPMAR